MGKNITKTAVLPALFAIIIWSFVELLIVELKSIPPFEFMFLVFVFGFLVVVTRYLLSKEKVSFFNFKKIDFIITSALLVSTELCYVFAFRFSPPEQVALINYLWPTLLILFSPILPKEKFCFSYTAAGFVSLLGLYFLFSPQRQGGLSTENIIGYSFALGAALSWTLYSLYTRFKKSQSSNCISWACGIAAVITLIIHLTTEKFVMPSIFETLLIALLGILSMGLAFYFWDNALKKGPIKPLSLASYSIPILSIFVLVLFGKTNLEQNMITATFAIGLAPLIPLIKNQIKAKK